MRNKCPVCHSTNVYRLHTARRIGSTVGAVGGAATGAGGALSLYEAGDASAATGVGFSLLLVHSHGLGGGHRRLGLEYRIAVHG